MGAVYIAPSKDTLWTTSSQPPTYSDTKTHGDYTTQPHVQLDSVLATLSLGPVGISDAYNYTDVFLISQSFRCTNDSTLLRPDRPLSWVDSFFYNASLGLDRIDIRSTHSQVPAQRGGSRLSQAITTHYVVAWRSASPVTLGSSDLYPTPPSHVSLAMRKHVVGPNASAQQQGCIDGERADNGCITMLCASCQPVIEATGTNLDNFSLTVIYEPLSNGAYFLGELTKFVHVSHQRFEYILVDEEEGGKAGIVVGVRGCVGEKILLTAITKDGLVSTASTSIPEGGFVDITL